MLNAADNELLTRTDAAAPMGQLFRRFWMPVLLSQQLPEPDCPPVRVKVMGEDLIAFRDSKNRIGLVEPHCPHRGANLFFGRNEECGIRCAFHGWKFDVFGECLEMTTVPRNDGYEKARARIRLKAYPTREAGDIIWAYLGPSETMTELPAMEFMRLPRRTVSSPRSCNNATGRRPARAPSTPPISPSCTCRSVRTIPTT
jgi:phthalate 4,5-dioxygenase oxygenase subunit